MQEPREILAYLVNRFCKALAAIDRPGRMDAGDGPVKALVAEQSLELGPADSDGYRWIDVPPVIHMEAVVFQPAS